MDRKTRILFVDDEKRLRDTSERVLTSLGYEVTTAENGKAALAVLSKVPIDIILLDLKMPVMGGEEALEVIQEKYPQVPVIIITAHPDLHTAVTCIKKGACDFLAKPFDVDQLLLSIDGALNYRKPGRRASHSEDEIVRTLLDFNTEKKRLKTIINCMADGVAVTNRDLDVVLHNPAFARLMELPQETRNSFPITKVIKDDSFIGALRKITIQGLSEDESISQEIHMGRKILRANSAPELAPDRNVFWTVVGAVTVLEDITAFKHLDEMKTDFVNMVVHELRSPLVAIRQLNSVLVEGLAGPLEPKQHELVKRGIKKIDTLLALINDLLDMAKMEARKGVQHQVPTDIGQIIGDVIALMEPRAREHGVTLHNSCKDLRPVRVDPKNMEEILNNLIDNAINYSPDGGEVTVTAQGLGEYLEIRVKDTGVGIPLEELPRIFDKFYRIKHPKTRNVLGTGLGLAIVKGLVEAHHGTIEVESVLDIGTTFRILLPMIA